MCMKLRIIAELSTTFVEVAIGRNLLFVKPKLIQQATRSWTETAALDSED